MTDLFEEVREDLLRAKYLKIWQDYGKYFIGGLILIIILVSGFFINLDYQNKKDERSTTAVFDLLYYLEQAQITEFDKRYSDLDSAPASYHKDLATLKKVDVELLEGNISKAYDLLFELYSDHKAYKMFRDYAELMLNYIIYRYPASDYSDNNVVLNITSDNIFYHNILEIRALGYVEQEKYAEAKNELDKIVSSVDAKVDNKKFAADLIRLLEESEKI